ncbi:unnamed protein product [Lampetra planeri]
MTVAAGTETPPGDYLRGHCQCHPLRLVSLPLSESLSPSDARLSRSPDRARGGAPGHPLADCALRSCRICSLARVSPCALLSPLLSRRQELLSLCRVESRSEGLGEFPGVHRAFRPGR